MEGMVFLEQHIHNIIITIPLALILILIVSDKIASRKKRKYLFLATLSILLENIVEVYDRVAYVDAIYNNIVWANVINIFAIIFSAATIYFLFCLVVEETKFQKYKLILSIPYLIVCVLTFLSPWFGFMYIIDENLEFHRGSIYIVFLVVLSLYYLLTIHCDLSIKRRYLTADKVCIAINYILLAIAFLIQTLYPEYVITSFCISILIMFYYVAFQSNLIKHDTLTGIFNRRMYDVAISTADRKKSLTIVNIDINQFKKINDTKGHKFGDDVLKICGQKLQHYFAKYGFTYRIGGDEFCIICKNIKPHIIKAIFEVVETDVVEIKVQTGIDKVFSYGYCEYIKNGKYDIFDCIKKADAQMYEYKNFFKN